jgi:signal transduction histidine kinase
VSTIENQTIGNGPEIVLVDLNLKMQNGFDGSSDTFRGSDLMTQSEHVVHPNSSDPAGEPPDYRQKLDEVATLVARVRHEINNPLTGVLGQAQLLLREDLNEKARKRAQSIEELALRLKDIVMQLREVQRP